MRKIAQEVAKAIGEQGRAARDIIKAARQHGAAGRRRCARRPPSRRRARRRSPRPTTRCGAAPSDELEDGRAAGDGRRGDRQGRRDAGADERAGVGRDGRADGRPRLKSPRRRRRCGSRRSRPPRRSRNRRRAMRDMSGAATNTARQIKSITGANRSHSQAVAGVVERPGRHPPHHRAQRRRRQGDAQRHRRPAAQRAGAERPSVDRAGARTRIELALGILTVDAALDRPRLGRLDRRGDRHRRRARRSAARSPTSFPISQPRGLLGALRARCWPRARCRSSPPRFTITCCRARRRTPSPHFDAHAAARDAGAAQGRRPHRRRHRGDRGRDARLCDRERELAARAPRRRLAGAPRRGRPSCRARWRRRCRCDAGRDAAPRAPRLQRAQQRAAAALDVRRRRHRAAGGAAAGRGRRPAHPGGAGARRAAPPARSRRWCARSTTRTSNVRFHAHRIARPAARRATPSTGWPRSPPATTSSWCFPPSTRWRGSATPAPRRRLVPLLERPLIAEPVARGARRARRRRGDRAAGRAAQRRRRHAAMARALARLHERYEERYGGGALIVAEFQAAVSAGGQRPRARGDRRVRQRRSAPARHRARLAGGDAVHRALTRLLGQAEVRADAIEAIVRQDAGVVDVLVEQLEAPIPTSARRDRRSRTPGEPARRAGDRTPRSPGRGRLSIAAAAALARIADPLSHDALLPLLADADPAVRQAAIGALNSLGHPDLAATVARLLRSDDPVLRDSAVRIAGYFGYPETRRRAARAAPPTPRRACAAPPSSTSPSSTIRRSLTVLATAVQDGSPKVRAVAAQALAHATARRGGGAAPRRLGRRRQLGALLRGTRAR